MSSKLSLVCVLLFVAAAAADSDRTDCDTHPNSLDVQCDALCWVVIPYRFRSAFFYNGCVDDEGFCWCCFPRLKGNPYEVGAYGGYGGYKSTYACPDEPSCQSDCYLSSVIPSCKPL